MSSYAIVYLISAERLRSRQKYQHKYISSLDLSTDNPPKQQSLYHHATPLVRSYFCVNSSMIHSIALLWAYTCTHHSSYQHSPPITYQIMLFCLKKLRLQRSSRYLGLPSQHHRCQKFLTCFCRNLICIILNLL